MALSEAMTVAIRLHQTPVMIRQVRRAPLPRDVVNLLEIAAGDPHALVDATATTALPPEKLQQVAGFFVEQILFHHRSDSYRILGAQPDAGKAEIARNLRLLMKWVHPDGTHAGAAQCEAKSKRTSDADIDRTVFAARVTAAWNDLKTEARRAVYDQNRARSQPQQSGRRAVTRLSSEANTLASKFGCTTKPAMGPARRPVARGQHQIKPKGHALMAKRLTAPRRRASRLRRFFDFLMRRH
jgi:hypothetical protein